MSIPIKEHIALAPFTTMRVGGLARFFAQIQNTDDLFDAVMFAQTNKLPVFVLGGGSNTLVSEKGFSGLVIKIEIKGINYEESIATVGAGEVWDEFVQSAVEKKFWGIENLSLIPGTVGGAAVQNIGAYGVEVRETILSVEAFDMKTMQIKKFLREECEFSYRESIFKKNKNLIVTRVAFKLSYDNDPHIDYEDVKKYFELHEIMSPTLSEIRHAVVVIRAAKMPAPPLGTAGSFFKNPVVTQAQYKEVKNLYPEIKSYLQGDNSVKLSAAWLIDHVGHWRGFRRGDAGVHEKQALILVNYGNATAEEMVSLAREIKNNIKEKTKVVLEEEVVTM